MAALQFRRKLRRRGAVNTLSPQAPLRPVAADQDVALVDVLDRLLAGGVVLSGDITLAVADIDLVYVGLRALISSVATAEREGLPLPR